MQLCGPKCLEDVGEMCGWMEDVMIVRTSVCGVVYCLKIFVARTAVRTQCLHKTVNW